MNQIMAQPKDRTTRKRPITATVLLALYLALIQATMAREVAEDGAERSVTFKTSDGWQIAGFMQVSESKSKVPGIVFVPASLHEIDAFDVHAQPSKPGLLRVLSQHHMATLRIDIRGRGGSREPREFHLLTLEERKLVRLDVEAAVNFLASQPNVDASRIGIVVEQDGAETAVMASARDPRIAAWVFVSARLSPSAKEAISATSVPIFCLVGKEDRRGFKDMTDVYLSSKSQHSRLRVFEGVPLGTTMFSMWRFMFPQEQPIDEMIGLWLIERLKTSPL